MTKRRDSTDLPKAGDERETLFEIARLIAEAEPARDGATPQQSNDAGAKQHPPEAASVPEAAGKTPPGDELTTALLEALPLGLALCAGHTLLRANAAFALAFGYGNARELIAAGGLAAVFPDHLGELAEPAARRGPGRRVYGTYRAMTRSRRRIEIPLAVHDLDRGQGHPVRLLVLRPEPPARSGEPETRDAAPSRSARHLPQLVAPPADAGVEQGREESAPREKPGRTEISPDFLAKVSHELRTPLNSVIGFAEMMLAESLGPIGNDRYRTYVRDIRDSGQYALSLVNDLLDLSKLEAGAFDINFTAVDANEVIEECVRLMQPQAQKLRVFLRMVLSDALPPVLADRRSLKQILLNLLSNAIKFTDAGGQVIVSSQRKASGAVRLRVHDTGVGMSKSEIARALQPFRQLDTAPRRQVGSGLGLPLTRALARANQAKFRIRSRPKSGTRVDLIFPADRVAER